MARVPHLQIPFQLGPDGSAIVLEQDTVEEVGQCVQVLVTTTLGQRLELPSYGISEIVFTTTAVDQSAVVAQILRWEPRARAVIDARPDALDEMIRDVLVTVGVGK